MDPIKQQLSQDVPAAPGFGLRKPSFGLTREPINRIELVLAMRGGGIINVFVELGEEVNAERLETYSAELAVAVKSGEQRSFNDSWTATGQRAWVDLSQVVAFSVRQAK